MNPKIDPEVALKKVDAFLEEIEEKKLLEMRYQEGDEKLDRIRKEIEGLLKATFSDSKERIDKYYIPYVFFGMNETDKQNRYISSVKRTINNLLSLKNELTLFIDSKGMQKEIKKETLPKGALTQHFHGDVQNLALGDINNYNTKVYFNALIKAIEASEDIPDEEKGNLIDRIKEIANNPYIAGIGAAAIFEGIKTVL